MAQQTAKLVIAFADISGSTRLYETLGDTKAREVVARCLNVMTRVVSEHGGTIIKTIGDEVMCTFPQADAAVKAAMDLQESVSDELSARDAGVPRGLSIRVGLHYGPAIVDGGDVFGDAVNIAARMAGQAKGGQIIMTQFIVEALTPKLRANTRCLDLIPVKGKRDHIQVHEVLWKDEDVTLVGANLVSPIVNGLRLRLSYRESQITLSQQSAPLTMGRGKGAGLVIKDKMASREHARIEQRRGKFVLHDQSTNGTYVRSEAGTIFLRMDEITLIGRGQISLGRNFDENSKEVVNFDSET